MSPPVAHLISLEVRNVIDRVCLIGFVSGIRRWASVAARNIEVVIHVTAEVGRPMKPGSRANEYAAYKPFRAVVSIRSAGVRSVIVVAVRARRLRPDIHAD